MMKSFNLILMTPIAINILLILIIMPSSKVNKFHPISLMFMLILLTLMISIKMNFVYKSWISFITFLTMIGGLMVIFMYIISLINNALFKSSYKIMIINVMKIMPMMIIMIILSNYFEYTLLNSNLQNSWPKSITFLMDQINMNLMYKKFFNKSTIFIMFYLYYSMICIMNICSKFKTPLRQMIL